MAIKPDLVGESEQELVGQKLTYLGLIFAVIVTLAFEKVHVYLPGGLRLKVPVQVGLGLIEADELLPVKVEEVVTSFVRFHELGR